MTQSAKESAQNSQKKAQQQWDMAEFDIRQRWRTRPPKEFPSPWACEWGFDEHGLWQVFSVKGPNGPVKHKMRFIPRGTFLMGSPEDEPFRDNNETQHQVELTQGFWLGETTVTQALWEAVTGQTPSKFIQQEDEQLPVEQVSWDDCIAFCEQLNQLKQGMHASLPTEAQWEYACRAGTQTSFHTGESLMAEDANFYDEEKKEAKKDRFKGNTVDVNLYQPNHWGLKQMHGNVWEWCLDSWDENAYSAEPIIDPLVTTKKNSLEKAAGDSEEVSSYEKSSDEELYVVRGGGWFSNAQNCRSARRSRGRRGNRNSDLGLRLCVRSTPYSQD